MTNTTIETRWVGIGIGLGALGCGPGGVDSLEGFGEGGDDDADESSDASETEGPFEGPFEVLAAEFEGNTALRLTFSHPVAPVEAVDPRDFRISWVFSTRYQGYYGGQYDSTQYRDPNVFGYYDYPMALRVGALVLESDVELKLEFESPLGPLACQYVGYWNENPPYPPTERIVGLFLHHRAGDIPVQDVQGNPLASFGAAWVEYEGLTMYTSTFGMPELDPRIEIPCP